MILLDLKDGNNQILLKEGGVEELLPLPQIKKVALYATVATYVGYLSSDFILLPPGSDVVAHNTVVLPLTLRLLFKEIPVPLSRVGSPVSFCSVLFRKYTHITMTYTAASSLTSVEETAAASLLNCCSLSVLARISSAHNIPLFVAPSMLSM